MKDEISGWRHQHTPLKIIKKGTHQDWEGGELDFFKNTHTWVGDREDVKIWARKNGIRELWEREKKERKKGNRKKNQGEGAWRRKKKG